MNINLRDALINLQYLTLLSLHTITVLPLTYMYFMSEIHCTSSVLHSIAQYYTLVLCYHILYKCKVNSHITVQSSTIVLLRSTVDYHRRNLFFVTYIHTYIRTYIHIHIHANTYIHTYTHIYIPTYIHTYIHKYVHVHIHTYIHTYMYIHTYIHTYIHVHTYIHNTCIHTYIHTYVYTHTHIHVCIINYDNSDHF